MYQAGSRMQRNSLKITVKEFRWEFFLQKEFAVFICFKKRVQSIFANLVSWFSEFVPINLAQILYRLIIFRKFVYLVSLSFYPRIWKDILHHESTAVEKICQNFLWNIEQKENFSELLTCSSPFPISFLPKEWKEK